MQRNDAELAELAALIANETERGGNSKIRIASLFNDLIESKVNSNLLEASVSGSENKIPSSSALVTYLASMLSEIIDVNDLESKFGYLNNVIKSTLVNDLIPKQSTQPGHEVVKMVNDYNSLILLGENTFTVYSNTQISDLDSRLTYPTYPYVFMDLIVGSGITYIFGKDEFDKLVILVYDTQTYEVIDIINISSINLEGDILFSSAATDGVIILSVAQKNNNESTIYIIAEEEVQLSANIDFCIDDILLRYVDDTLYLFLLCVEQKTVFRYGLDIQQIDYFDIMTSNPYEKLLASNMGGGLSIFEASEYGGLETITFGVGGASSHTSPSIKTIYGCTTYDGSLLSLSDKGVMEIWESTNSKRTYSIGDMRARFVGVSDHVYILTEDNYLHSFHRSNRTTIGISSNLNIQGSIIRINNGVITGVEELTEYEMYGFITFNDTNDPFVSIRKNTFPKDHSFSASIDAEGVYRISSPTFQFDIDKIHFNINPLVGVGSVYDLYFSYSESGPDIVFHAHKSGDPIPTNIPSDCVTSFLIKQINQSY